VMIVGIDDTETGIEATDDVIVENESEEDTVDRDLLQRLGRPDKPPEVPVDQGRHPHVNTIPADFQSRVWTLRTSFGMDFSGWSVRRPPILPLAALAIVARRLCYPRLQASRRDESTWEACRRCALLKT
jgi:hypothetical protein